MNNKLASEILTAPIAYASTVWDSSTNLEDNRTVVRLAGHIRFLVKYTPDAPELHFLCKTFDIPDYTIESLKESLSLPREKGEKT